MSKSRKKKGWFGDEYIEHEDGSTSREKEGWFGDKYIEHSDGSTTRKKEGWFGDTYYEHSDGTTSREKEGWFGDKYIEHEDGSTTREKKDWFGDTYYEHEGKSTAYPNSRKNTSSSSSSTTSGETLLIQLVIGVVLVLVAIYVAIWLAVNVVLPVVLLNTALIFTVLALIAREQKALFAALAFVGGGYLVADSLNGWLSFNFVHNVTSDPGWIAAFIYINAVAIGVSALLLLQSAWAKANLIRATEKGKGIALMILIAAAIVGATAAAPLIFHTTPNPFVASMISFSSSDTKDNGFEPVPPPGAASGQPASQVSRAEQQIASRLNALFNDISNQRLAANVHFASNVEQYISLKNVTPATINQNFEKWSYPEFKNYTSRVQPGSFRLIEEGPSQYKTEFIQEVDCYRISKQSNWKIMVTVEAIFNADFKITSWKEIKVHKSEAASRSNTSGNAARRFPEASRRLLTDADLRTKSKSDLRIMRNEIFAGHGYIFKTSEMKGYFDKQTWYRPRYSNVSGKLTDIENENVRLIQAYEKR